MPGEFLDSNVLVCAFSNDPRAEAAQELLQRGCTISVQGLNEFVHVTRRKLRLPWPQVRVALSSIRDVCPTILPIDVETHDLGLELAEQHSFSIFDALMVAAALRANLHTLWMEDMQDGMVVRGSLRIANPFEMGTR